MIYPLCILRFVIYLYPCQCCKVQFLGGLLSFNSGDRDLHFDNSTNIARQCLIIDVPETILFHIQQSVDEMKEQFEEMMKMVKQALQRNNLNNYGAQALNQTVPVKSKDIIIIGGYYTRNFENTLDTVEKYNIEEAKSSDLPQMNHPRAESASCVYKGDVIVAGGDDGKDGTDTIEILKMNQDPLRWRIFDVKQPVKLSSHVVVVYKDKLYVIGGFNWNKGKTSDDIYELSLVPPYTVKYLIRMPQPRRHHRAEIVNDKLYILGGRTANSSKDTIDSVVVYDFMRNEIKQCQSLPKPVSLMSTVAWGNMIIIIGGRDKNDETLDDVIMYDTETGRSQNLPPMIHIRCGHCAVIMNDVIVVFGGWNREKKHLNSVETFSIGSNVWKKLPGMKEKRNCASAVVKPQ